MLNKNPGGRKLKKSRFKKKREKWEREIADIVGEPLRVAVYYKDVLEKIFEVVDIRV